MEPTKAIWQSKTFWVNFLTLVVGVIGMISGSEVIADNPKLVAGLATALAVTNVILRFLTDRAVTLMGGMREKQPTKRFG